MSRAAFVTREFRCLRCSPDAPMRHFRAQFWTARKFRGRPLTPSYYELRCPLTDDAGNPCGAGAQWFEPWPRACSMFITPLREELRPVVFRWRDKLGREHYRYPASSNPADYAKQASDDGKYELRMRDGSVRKFSNATSFEQAIMGDPSFNGALARPGEERVDFPTLRSMESFLKAENPNYRDWQVPLNDLLDYDEAHLQAVAEDTSDPEGDAEMRELAALGMDDFGVTTEAEANAYMERTDARELIEKA